jgi:hypothetical protein
MGNQFGQLVCWVADQVACGQLRVNWLSLECAVQLMDLPRGNFLCNFHCILMYYIGPKCG